MGGMIAQELVSICDCDIDVLSLLSRGTGIYCSRQNSLALVDLRRTKNLQYCGVA